MSYNLLYSNNPFSSNPSINHERYDEKLLQPSGSLELPHFGNKRQIENVQ